MHPLAAQPMNFGETAAAMFCVGAVVFVAWVILHTRDKRVAQAAAKAAADLRARSVEDARLAGDHGVTMSETDKVLFEQHKRMNELTIAKLEAEVALMQAQLKTRADDDDRMHAAKEYHELTVEKTRLEIDSLRLHIAEQRKRIDDWGLGGG